MIAAPLNDRACLDKITALAVRATARRDVAELAARFTDTAAVAGWIRQLPQRDDRGMPEDVPAVACDVPQRARVVASDPNCVERALLYIAVAELIDPRPPRSLATLSASRARHTIVVEAGTPVILDPVVHVLNGGARGGARNGFSLPINVRQLVEWVGGIARQAAAQSPTTTTGNAQQARIERADGSLRQLADGVPAETIRRTPGLAEDIDFLLGAASTAAPAFGPAGVAGVAVTRSALRLLGVLPKPRRPAVGAPGAAPTPQVAQPQRGMEPETKG